MNGCEGPRCQSVRQFARDLESSLRLPSALWDERLDGSVERFLIDQADFEPRTPPCAVIDRAAAAWILQGALDAIRHSRPAGTSESAQ